MTYIADLRANWRAILAAVVGLSCGSVAMSFTNNIMGPHLLREFGWSKASFALIGTLGLVALIGMPLAGRLSDIIGVRRTALIGTIAAPICCFAYGQMTGSFSQYVAIIVVQNLLCMTTATATFTRIVVHQTNRARGMALALAASGPAVAMAVGGPLFHEFVGAYGWRTGYLALAAYTFIGGMIAVLLVPTDNMKVAEKKDVHLKTRDYSALLRTPAFWMLGAAILLSNTFNFILTGQLNVLMLANHLPTHQVGGMLSVFAVGTLMGRLISGLALDRFPAQIVGAIALGLPSIGLFLIASSYDTVMVLGASVLLLGMAFGAEADVLGYVVSRTFDIAIYGTVMGLMIAAIPLGGAMGAFVLSRTLATTGGYGMFLVISGICTMIGSTLFLFLPIRNPREVRAKI